MWRCRSSCPLLLANLFAHNPPPLLYPSPAPINSVRWWVRSEGAGARSRHATWGGSAGRQGLAGASGRGTARPLGARGGPGPGPLGQARPDTSSHFPLSCPPFFPTIPSAQDTSSLSPLPPLHSQPYSHSPSPRHSHLPPGAACIRISSNNREAGRQQGLAMVYASRWSTPRLALRAWRLAVLVGAWCQSLVCQSLVCTYCAPCIRSSSMRSLHALLGSSAPRRLEDGNNSLVCANAVADGIRRQDRGPSLLLVRGRLGLHPSRT